ncbi:MAG: type IV secretion system protein [Proteobacteria bacterium]|nr:type IV secretion system protein [Pseudomonadota bacterium]
MTIQKLLRLLKGFKFQSYSSFNETTLITEGRIIETGHVYRMLIWVARFLGFGFLMSLFINIVCAVLMINLFPLKTIVPFFITLMPKSEQIVKIEPIEDQEEGFDVMTESLARNYVRLRETLDFQTEADRWKQVFWFSSFEIFENFKALMNKDQGGIYESRKEKKLYRDVILLSVSTLSKNPRIVQVEWQGKDYQEGGEIYKKNWVSTLSITYISQNVKFEDRYMNPLGFIVTAYGVSEKSGGEKEE